MLTLAELEPYRHLTRNEVLDLYDKQIISESDMRIKLNFANFVRRFEREYLNVLEFGYNMPFNSKINFHKLVADTLLVRINCIWKFNKQI